MDSSRVVVGRKRKLSGPSSWPRVFKATSAPKREPPKASLSGRLTERQQLALALEESRKDSLPQQQDQEHPLQRCDSGEQSSSLRCCDDDIAANRSSSSSKVRLKQQQHGRMEDGVPGSPCRTNSHEQASTSGQAGAVASTGAAKTAGTLLSSSMSSGTSKQSASTAFKVPFSCSRHGASAVPCPTPISVPDVESDPSPSDPASPVSRSDRLIAPANVSSSSTSELTGLQPSEHLPTLLQNGDLPAESAVLSNDHQLEFGHSQRLGSMTPSVSHSVAPGSLDIYHPCKKLRSDSSDFKGTVAAAAAFTSPAARTTANIKIRVKLGAAEGTAKATSDTPVASLSRPPQTAASLQSAKRLAEPVQPNIAQGPAAKRLKLEQQDSLPHPVSGRNSSFRKPRSKSVKGKLVTGRPHPARPSIPLPVFEAVAGEPAQSQQTRPKQPSAPASCLMAACCQLVDLDRRSCDEATTCLPRNSAFVELKRDEEDSSESDEEDSAAAAQRSPSVPPLAYFEDCACDITLASKLTSLRLADHQAGSKLALHSCPQSLVAQFHEVGGKLSKAHRACQQSAFSHTALLPGVTDCCSFLYQPLRAAAATRPAEMKSFVAAPPAAACGDTSRHGVDATAGVSGKHAADVLGAVQNWIVR